jgi:flagellar biosynthesis component FlhA
MAMDEGKDKVVLLCDSRVRSPLAKMLSRTVPLLPVVAYDEIVFGTEVENTETISINQFDSGDPKGQEFAIVSK